MLSRDRLESLLSAFPKLTIGLVGDLFLDRYLDIEADVEEISIETGLEAFQIQSVRNSPGALGTVMNNLAALGVGRLVPVTVIGDDGHGYDLKQALQTLPIDGSYLIEDPERLTPTYTKPLKQEADGTRRELNRFDIRTRGPLTAATQQLLNAHVQAAFAACDGLIVLDQINETDWGVVNAETRRVLKSLAEQAPNKVMFVDSRTHLADFEFGILKGNQTELLRAIGEPDSHGLTVEQASRQLVAKTGQPVYTTLGDAGIFVVTADGQADLSRVVPVDGAIDIVGAGDSATSGIVSALLSGATHLEAADIGNLVASITIQQLGTTGTASPEQVIARHAEQ